MAATIHFTSSDIFMDTDEGACEHATIEINGYIEGTYNTLRHGSIDGRGEEIARYDGAWQLNDGRRFSDWAVSV